MADDQETKLTYKQAMFVQEYLVDLNGTQAAIRAGYSENSAKEQAHENLTKPHIQKAIEEAMEDRVKRVQITQDKILNELALIGFSDMRNYVEYGPVGVTLKELESLPEEQSRAISEVSHNFTSEGGGSVKFKLYDKPSALVNMGKHLGMFPNKTELDLPQGLTIKFDSDDANHA